MRTDNDNSLADAFERFFRQLIIQIKADLPQLVNERTSCCYHIQTPRRQHEAERPETRYPQSRCATACRKIVENDVTIGVTIGQGEHSRFACVEL